MIDTVNAARPRPHFRLRGDASRIEVTWLTSEGEDPYRVVEDPEVRRIDGHPFLQARGDRRWGHLLSEEAAAALVRGGVFECAS